MARSCARSSSANRTVYARTPDSVLLFAAQPVFFRADVQPCCFPILPQVSYTHVDGMLQGLARGLGYEGENPVHRVYAVGDNPHTDIAGANGAGAHWTSMLVRTGIFGGDGARNDAVHPADHVVTDCWAAVQTALELERARPTI